jgi:putative transposase
MADPPTHHGETVMNGAQVRFPHRLLSQITGISVGRGTTCQEPTSVAWGLCLWRNYDWTMPHRLKRFQKAEALHLITFSCLQRLPLLRTADAKNVVEVILEQARARHEARIYAYVLMPEHVHLLVNEPPMSLVGEFLKAVKQITSRKLRGGYPRLWQERYHDSSIRGEAARTEVIRYIHRNPVKRGLVAAPGDYRWSSFNHYATGVRGVVEIESEWTARFRGPLVAKKIEMNGE